MKRCITNLPSSVKHLHALAAAIRNIDETVVRYPRGVDRLHELQRAGSGQLLGRDAVAFRHLRLSRHIIERLVAERAPHALERAGIASNTMMRRLP